MKSVADRTGRRLHVASILVYLFVFWTKYNTYITYLYNHYQIQILINDYLSAYINIHISYTIAITTEELLTIEELFIQLSIQNKK